MTEKNIAKELKRFNKPYFSQLKQDIVALIISNYKTNGYFVEFGACDGVHFSNTLMLEKNYNWTGILAEPSKIYHNDLVKNRSSLIDFRAVYSASKKILTFKEASQSDLSGIIDHFQEDNHYDKRLLGNEYQVETISLNDLLAEHNAPNTIDYLSLDTEGSEFEILKFFDFSKYSINFISVEHNFVIDQRLSINQLLENNGFVKILEKYSSFDDWYINKSLLGVIN